MKYHEMIHSRHLLYPIQEVLKDSCSMSRFNDGPYCVGGTDSWKEQKIGYKNKNRENKNISHSGAGERVLFSPPGNPCGVHGIHGIHGLTCGLHGLCIKSTNFTKG